MNGPLPSSSLPFSAANAKQPAKAMSASEKVWKSFAIMWTYAKPRRLLWEDPGVKSAAWFGKDPRSRWHVLGNVLRLTIAIILGPLYLSTPWSASSWVEDYLKNISWFVESLDTPEAVLYSDNGPGEYDAAAPHPHWLLRVSLNEDGSIHFKQVTWEKALDDPAFKTRGTPYTAISYDMESAYTLFQESGLATLDKVPLSKTRRWSLRDRKRISERLLREYNDARQRAGEVPKVEYVWLDEFCLSEDRLKDDAEIDRQRSYELGHLADIFRSAARVCVFCDALGCDHTTLACRWGTRLFTIGEIIHAEDIVAMTRRQTNPLERPTTELNFVGERTFKRKMQVEAAKHKKWHLSAILQHATNSGAMPWQAAIHALVVEAIRRDEASNFTSHRFLGKALNGLLPRRARLQDLKGENGWEDLAWLLELNQGFYNASSLAAVCSLAAADVHGYRWWGKPIAPLEGNERLEPLVTSFPVRISQNDNLKPCLCIMAPRTLVLSHKLKRDAFALYNHEDLRALKLLLHVVLIIVAILVAIIVASTGQTGILAVLYIGVVLYVIIELLAGTVYVVQDGWVYLDDREWGHDPREELAKRDPDFREKVIQWGEKQLIPKWQAPLPEKEPSRSVGTLVDLKSRVFVRTEAIDSPNHLIILAVHGNGITCLLLKRPENSNLVSPKVGIVSMPPYIWAQATWSATVYVGGARNEVENNSVEPANNRSL